MKRDFSVFARLCAFIAVLLAALVAILYKILPGNVIGTISLIKDIMLLVAVLLSGWMFASKLKPAKAWRIIYLVSGVLCVLGVLFGHQVL